MIFIDAYSFAHKIISQVSGEDVHCQRLPHSFRMYLKTNYDSVRSSHTGHSHVKGCDDALRYPETCSNRADRVEEGFFIFL